MKKSFFITGTDTDAGKTFTTIGLMCYFKRNGVSVVGMKPIAAGCHLQDGILKNEDALLMQDNASINLPYQQINPYAFEQPVSPHLAAEGQKIDLQIIKKAFTHLQSLADVVLVEGAGGWMAPVNEQDSMADLAKTLQIPVILVVAIRLGCINHAQLTFQAIQSSGQQFAGWVAVCIEPEMLMQEENIATLKRKISAPLLGIVPFIDGQGFELVASHLDNSRLI